MENKKYSDNNSNKKMQSNREKMRVRRRTAVASDGRQLNGLPGIYINKREIFVLQLLYIFVSVCVVVPC